MVDMYKYIAFINQQKANMLIVTSSITKISLTYLFTINTEEVPAGKK